MTSLLLAASLLIGNADVGSTLDPRSGLEAEPAISIVDALLVDVTEQTVTTSEPMVETEAAARTPDPPHVGAVRSRALQ